MPLKLSVLAGAEQVEHDATETKFRELILHIALMLFGVFIFITVSTCIYESGNGILQTIGRTSRAPLLSGL